MSTRSQSRMPFQLEMLETRTLLSGDLGAITSTGSIITNFDPEAVSSKITIASVEGGNLNIDSALLPNSVKELRISGFETVTITGTDGFQKIELSNIGSFSGAGIDVTSELKTKEVASLNLHSITGIARLNGDTTRLEVVDARSATILSDVEHLVVNSANPMDLWAVQANQELRFEFRSDQFKDEAELLEFLKDFKERSNILDFQVIYPEGPRAEGEDPFNGYFYVIITISVPSANTGDFFLLRLQDALKSGDSESVRSALLDFLHSASLSESPYVTALPGDNAVQADLFDSTSAFTDAMPLTAGDYEAPNTDKPLLSASELRLSIVEENLRLAHTLGEDWATRVAPAEVSLSPLEISVLRLDATPEADRSHLHFEEKGVDGVLDRIRSTLSSLLTNMDTRAVTVSGYIIDRVGHELEPGTLPGLLVDAKAMRSKRDFGWVQL